MICLSLESAVGRSGFHNLRTASTAPGNGVIELQAPGAEHVAGHLGSEQQHEMLLLPLIQRMSNWSGPLIQHLPAT